MIILIPNKNIDNILAITKIKSNYNRERIMECYLYTMRTHSDLDYECFNSFLINIAVPSTIKLGYNGKVHEVTINIE